MSLVLIRVDDRLIHGQITEVWVPYLNANRIIVVDDEIAQDPTKRKILGLGVPPLIQFDVWGIEEAVKEYSNLLQNRSRTLILFGNLETAYQAHQRGFRYTQLNLGNIHENDEGGTLSPSICLCEGSLDRLGGLTEQGVAITIQAIPSEKGVPFGRFRRGS